VFVFVFVSAAEQLNFFERYLTCVSNLCLGRTKTCADIVMARFPFELCFAVATDEKLQGSQLSIRAAFLRIIRTLYVDRDPYMDLSHLNHTRVWGKFAADVPKLPRGGFYE
jgi:hypothetical protein